MFSAPTNGELYAGVFKVAANVVRPEIFENDIGNLFNLHYCIINRLRVVWGEQSRVIRNQMVLIYTVFSTTIPTHQL